MTIQEKDCKKMKKIKKVNILGESIKVEYGKLEGVYGYCDYYNSHIGIDKDLKGVELNKTLLHEMFHATLRRLGLLNMDEGLEEVIVETFASVVVDNFKITKV